MPQENVFGHLVPQAAPPPAPSVPQGMPTAPGVIYGKPKAPPPPPSVYQQGRDAEAEARARRDQQLQEQAAARTQAEFDATHNPDGSPKLSPAQQADAGKPTEAQQRTSTLLSRIKGGFSDIQAVTSKDPTAQEPGLIETMRGGLAPDGLLGVPVRALAGESRRTVHDSQVDVLDALLTLGTGAAYNKEQLAGQMVAYFPQHNDTPDEIAVKNQRMKRLIEAAKVNAGPKWGEVEAAIAPYMSKMDGAANPQTGGGAPVTREQSMAIWGADLRDKDGNPLGPDGGQSFNPDGSPAGFASRVTQDQAPEGQSAAQAFGAGMGDIVQGAGDVLGIVGNPVNATINAVTGSDLSTDLGQTLRDASGLPDSQNQTISAINRAGTGGLLTAGAAGLAARLPGAVGAASEIAASRPIAQATGAAAGGGASDMARQSGAGPLGQIGAGLIGGVAGYGGANALARTASRAAGQSAPNALQSAANDLKISLLPADTGGVGTRMATGALGKTLGGIPLAEGAEKSIQSAANARNALANDVGSVSDKAGAGQAVRRGFNDFVKSSTKRAEQLFEAIPVPAEKPVELKATRDALTAVTQGFRSNPDLSRLWVNHPRLKATLEALTPTDTREAGRVKLMMEEERFRGAQTGLNSAKEEAVAALQSERRIATGELEQATAAYEKALSAARQEMVSAQRAYETANQQVPTLRSQPSSLKATADTARERYQSLKFKNSGDASVQNVLGPIKAAEQKVKDLSAAKPSTPQLTEAEKALKAATEAKDSAYVEANQPPAGGALSWADMKRFRSIVGEIVGQPGIKSDGSDLAALRKLYGALSSDMEATAASTGERALTQFRRANQYWRGREGRVEDVFSSLFGKGDQRSDEAVFNQINTWASNSGGDFARIAKTLRSMPKDEADTVRATVIQRMGMEKKGDNPTEVFSPAVFSSQWAALSNRAKSVLFNNKQHRDDLEKLAMVADKMKKAGEFQNFSNTSLGVNVTAQGALALTNLPVAVALAGLQFGGGKLLASPRFARILASSADLPPQASSVLVKRLGVLASEQPALAGDAKALQQHLMDTFGQSPGRMAASEKEDNRGPKPPQ